MSVPASPAVPGRGQVLVVDDDPAMRVSLEAVLCEDFEVISASNIAEARGAMHDHAFDVVLTDYEMPDGNGMEFLRRLGDEFPSVMGILITGHPDAPELRTAEKADAVVRVLAKPYDPARLIRLVENTIKLARMKRATTRLTGRIGTPRTS